jgi:Lrp/AsnC family transcriptional regulator, leucine-responsive regulatory protein
MYTFQERSFFRFSVAIHAHADVSSVEDHIISKFFRMQMERRIDRIDRKIIAELLANARLTNAELAARVGLSASPCWQRVRRLEAEGYIQGYSAILDQARFGLPETVLIEVTLDRHDERVLEEFGRAMAGMPEVLEVYLTTGEYDYFIKVAVESTAGYEQFLRKKLYKIPGIRHSRSSFTLRCLKRSHSPAPPA